jgi:hypothetical protein
MGMEKMGGKPANQEQDSHLLDFLGNHQYLFLN